MSYNSAAIKSVAYNPKRDDFLKELDKLDFDKLVKKYCSDRMPVRVKRRTKYVIRVALQKTGMLSAARKLLRKICKVYN